MAITKAIVGEPVLTDRGNYVVTYQLVVENTGTVDLAGLSLLEDTSSQCGLPFVKAGNLTIIAEPNDPGSSVSVDSAGWNGKISVELLDSSAANLLVTGDSVTIQFEVELNPSKATSAREKMVSSTGKTFSANGKSPAPGGRAANDSATIGNVLKSFTDSPGPIYSGTPIDQVPSPFSANSENAFPNQFSVPSRFSVGDGSIISAV